MSEPSQSNLPSDSHLRAIGAIAILWNAVEALLEIIVCHLYSVPLSTGLVLTSNIGLQGRLSILRIAAKNGAVQVPAEASAILSLADKIEKAASLRNDAVHGVWTASLFPGIAQRMAIKARGTRLRQTIEFSEADNLEAGADELQSLLGELHVWMERQNFPGWT